MELTQNAAMAQQATAGLPVPAGMQPLLLAKLMQNAEQQARLLFATGTAEQPNGVHPQLLAGFMPNEMQQGQVQVPMLPPSQNGAATGAPTMQGRCLETCSIIYFLYCRRRKGYDRRRNYLLGSKVSSHAPTRRRESIITKLSSSRHLSPSPASYRQAQPSRTSHRPGWHNFVSSCPASSPICTPGCPHPSCFPARVPQIRGGPTHTLHIINRQGGVRPRERRPGHKALPSRSRNRHLRPAARPLPPLPLPNLRLHQHPFNPPPRCSPPHRRLRRYKNSTRRGITTPH